MANHQGEPTRVSTAGWLVIAALMALVLSSVIAMAIFLPRGQARVNRSSVEQRQPSIGCASQWSRRGSGDYVFDMPSCVRRVRIVATSDREGVGQNFSAKVGGRLVVNEILGGTSFANDAPRDRRYDGTVAVSGGEVEIRGNGVTWSFTEVKP